MTSPENTVESVASEAIDESSGKWKSRMRPDKMVPRLDRDIPVHSGGDDELMAAVLQAGAETASGDTVGGSK